MKIYHYDDVKQLDVSNVRPPVGWDVYVLLMDDYKSKILLTETALKIGYLLGGENMNEYQKHKEQLREEAIDTQRRLSEESTSWEEVAEIQEHFETEGRKYGLLREFRENGIL